MDALILPGKMCNPVDFDTTRLIVENGPSLELVLVELLESRGRRVTFIPMDDDGRPLLLAIVRFAGGSEVFFSVRKEILTKGLSLFNPADGVQSLADCGTPIIDQDWLAQRDQALQIRARKSRAGIEMEIAPAGTMALLLSYAFTQFGQVNMSRDEWLDRGGRFHDGLRLDLSYLGDAHRPGIGETIWVDWMKFGLYARRNKSQDVPRYIS